MRPVLIVATRLRFASCPSFLRRSSDLYLSSGNEVRERDHVREYETRLELMLRSIELVKS